MPYYLYVFVPLLKEKQPGVDTFLRKTKFKKGLREVCLPPR